MPLKPYPTWCCFLCGHYAQDDKSKIFQNSTWHIDKCDACGWVVSVTQPRDFGYPNFEGHEAP